MIVGSPERFAIEVEPRDVDGEWIWGGFRFWLANSEIGDWEDATALHLCWLWLKKFCSHPPACVEPAVAVGSAEEVFRRVVDPVFGPEGIADPSKQPVPFAYERFHITHVGMSSFDSFVVVLVKDEIGNERCLWRKDDETTIHDSWLGPGEMERVVGEFCSRFEGEYMARA